MVICAPVSSVSGYGEHARDLVSSYIEHDKYDVKIIDVPWGDCPRNALKLNNEIHKKMINRILPQPVQITQQPDIYVDIRIPNEFQQIGKFNIGVTAGIETSLVAPEWVEGANRVDLNIVMDSEGNFLEIQGTGEKTSFTRKELVSMLDLGEKRPPYSFLLPSRGLDPRAEARLDLLQLFPWQTSKVRLTSHKFIKSSYVL